MEDMPDKTFRIERPHPRKKVMIRDLMRPKVGVARQLRLMQEQKELCRNLESSINEMHG